MTFEVGPVIRVRFQNLESLAESLRFPDFHEWIDSTNQQISLKSREQSSTATTRSHKSVARCDGTELLILTVG